MRLVTRSCRVTVRPPLHAQSSRHQLRALYCSSLGYLGWHHARGGYSKHLYDLLLQPRRLAGFERAAGTEEWGACCFFFFFLRTTRLSPTRGHCYQNYCFQVPRRCSLGASNHASIHTAEPRRQSPLCQVSPPRLHTPHMGYNGCSKDIYPSAP